MVLCLFRHKRVELEARLTVAMIGRAQAPGSRIERSSWMPVTTSQLQRMVRDIFSGQCSVTRSRVAAAAARVAFNQVLITLTRRAPSRIVKPVLRLSIVDEQFTKSSLLDANRVEPFEGALVCNQLEL